MAILPFLIIFFSFSFRFGTTVSSQITIMQLILLLLIIIIHFQTVDLVSNATDAQLIPILFIFVCFWFQSVQCPKLHFRSFFEFHWLCKMILWDKTQKQGQITRNHWSQVTHGIYEMPKEKTVTTYKFTKKGCQQTGTNMRLETLLFHHEHNSSGILCYNL